MISKAKLRRKWSWSERIRTWSIAAVVGVLIVCVIWSLKDPRCSSSQEISLADSSEPVPRKDDPEEATFYDDPDLSYTVDTPMKNWDEKRKEWLRLHPAFAAGVENRSLLLTGSQPWACENPSGDHLLLRCFKNKVDYARIHGIDIFYSNSFLNPNMRSYWSKLPLVRAAMLSHPEVEWIWWMDSDAIFTDMDFKVPMERYKNYNFVVNGWPTEIYEKRSWTAVNAGIFLIRNCQWSMEFLDVWGSMGPQTPDYVKWGKTLQATLSDKMFPESDDQSALVYLLLKEKDTWGRMMYIENEYSLHGYWRFIVGKYEEITKRYEEVEKATPKLRRRHAEAVRESYGEIWEKLVQEDDDLKNKWRKPFITHFTGCQYCSGQHNPAYKSSDCWKGMERALTFADNQVLRGFGFGHPELWNISVVPRPYDFPGAAHGDDPAMV